MPRPGQRAFQAQAKENTKAPKLTGLESRNGLRAKVTGEGEEQEDRYEQGEGVRPGPFGILLLRAV